MRVSPISTKRLFIPSTAAPLPLARSGPLRPARVGPRPEPIRRRPLPYRPARPRRSLALNASPQPSPAKPRRPPRRPRQSRAHERVHAAPIPGRAPPSRSTSLLRATSPRAKTASSRRRKSDNMPRAREAAAASPALPARRTGEGL
jgi:hypothetical protein